jgi:hypothetical protein
VATPFEAVIEEPMGLNELEVTRGKLSIPAEVDFF